MLGTKARNAIISSMRKNYLTDNQMSIADACGSPYIIGKIRESLDVVSNLPMVPESGEVMQKHFNNIAQWAIFGMNKGMEMERTIDGPSTGISKDS